MTVPTALHYESCTTFLQGTTPFIARMTLQVLENTVQEAVALMTVDGDLRNMVDLNRPAVRQLASISHILSNLLSLPFLVQ